MKKLFALSFGIIISAAGAHAADWWTQPTICRIDTTRCYGSLSGAGFDDEMWDANANCRGMKYVCPAATTADDRAPVLIGRQEINAGIGIDQDFDLSVLNRDEACFGMRRTSANGTMASVNGRMVNVYCMGVLARPDEIVINGEITYDVNGPTCTELARDGYVATLNGKCYGKYYNPNQYYIECGTGLLPTQLIVLNGADIWGATGNGIDKAAADKLFDKMYSKSQTQKQKYFNRD